MLTFDDKGGRGIGKPSKHDYVIHGCSLSNVKLRGRFLQIFIFLLRKPQL